MNVDFQLDVCVKLFYTDDVCTLNSTLFIYLFWYK
jgi:hypothetical protein